MNNKTNLNSKVFMAFATGKESTEGSVIKRYIGVAPVFVLAVNPNKAALEKLYNTELENSPEYCSVGELVKGDGLKVEQCRIDFIVKTDPEKSNGIEFMSKVSFFLKNAEQYNKDKTKCKVIDKYGRTAWVTSEEYKTKSIPVYANGPANIDSDYRACLLGEEDLTNFIKDYLNIPNVMDYKKGVWVMKDNPSDCEARLECISKYFKGDFSELNTIISFQPTNKIKAMFGVKTTNEGKQYQTVFTQKFLKNGVQPAGYTAIDKVLQEKKSAGALADSEFSICEIKEYTVESTSFTQESTEVNNPFPPATSDSPWA